MPKPAFIEANVDQALLSSGRALVVTDYSQSNQRIEVVSTSPKYKVEFVSTIMDESEELPKEIVKLRCNIQKFTTKSTIKFIKNKYE